jgi:hypothetical protein
LPKEFFRVRPVQSTLPWRNRRDAGLFGFFLFDHCLDLFLAAFFLDNPIISTIIVIAPLLHNLLEKSSQIVVIGLFFKHDVAAVLQVLREFFGRSGGQLLDSSLDFALFDPVVLVVLILACETLPG